MMYNINDTIQMMEVFKTMNVSAAITELQKSKKYDISKEVSTYIKYVKNESFYIDQTVQDIRLDGKLPTKNAKFILFSAPGATGKSKLAYHMSEEYDALYWDLSKIRLGTNSFVGSILSAVGNDNYSSYMSDLCNSKAFLIIDALDEAEIVSGRNMLSDFLMDINKNIKNNTSPCIVIFSRTETAQFIVSLFAQNNIALKYYEIGFFTEEKSKEFIRRSINASTAADEECINTYYNAIKDHISENDGTSLLGYAPVLQAISEDIKDNENRGKLLSTLERKQSYIDIICKIMSELLDREHEKVRDAFITRCKSQHPEFKDWDCVYTAEAQLNSILRYVLMGDMEDEITISKLPAYLIDEYNATVATQIQQHPFIARSALKADKIDFIGPAFRDYTLAKLILSDMDIYADLYIDEVVSNHYIPSRIFYDCYKTFNTESIDSKYLSVLYDSFKSRTTAKEHANLLCMAIDEDEYNAMAEFGINGTTPAKPDSFGLTIHNNEIKLSQCSNMTIQLPDTVIKIGMPNSSCRIQSSTIICKRIEWLANTVIFESFSGDECILYCKEDVPSNSHTEFDVRLCGSIKVDIPNIREFYRLIPYKYDLNNETEIDPIKFVNALRIITSEFRTHKKDTLGKDAERIDNVTVGSSDLKRKVFSYLISKGIVYKSGHLYKIDMSKMDESGLNYWDLKNLNIDSLNAAYEEYMSFINK